MSDEADPNLQPIADPLPDPPKAEGKVGAVMNYVKEKGGAVASTLKEKSAAVYGTTKEKASETYAKLKENERFQTLEAKTKEYAGAAQEKMAPALEKGKALTSNVVEKTAEYKTKAAEKTAEYREKATQKAGEIKTKVSEKSAEYLDKTKDVRERASVKTKEIWAKGKGKIVKIRNEVGLTWGKSAQEVLLQREEAAKKWKDIKIRGAEEITVSARSEFTTAYLVEKGTLMRWSFRVQGYDIGFGVRVRIMQDGGSREEDVLAVERYDNVDTIEGSWVADEDRTMVLVFDNTYSKLRSKTVAYLVGTEKAPEDSADEPTEEGDAA